MNTRPHWLRMLFAVLLSLQGAVASGWSRDREVLTQFRAIETAFDRKLKIEYTADLDHLPKAWRRAAISAKLTPISDAELRRFPAILREALARYPKAVITKNLRKVVLLESISFYGLEYGATYSADTIFLSSKGRGLGYTDRYLVEGFHHEFSSILFKNYRFPEQSWKFCNPDDFKYSGSGVSALRKGETSLEGNEKLYRQGFLSPYSTSALEEDFNVYSSVALSQPERLSELMRRYPNIRKKFKVWIDFYRSVDPSYFSEARILGFRSSMPSIRAEL